MKNTIFDYQDYKKYLSDVIKSKPEQGRGVKSALAAAIKCQNAYISQVLNGPADFSLEQADSINQFLGHNQDESDYFLLLVQYARAGTASLKSHFKNKVADATEKQLALAKHVKVNMELSSEAQSIYFSAWYYAAVHVLLTLPQFQNREAIAKQLGLAPSRVTEILEFLAKNGLVVREKGKYKVGPVHIHLQKGSPMMTQHHVNWRLQAVRSLNRDKDADLHYSSIVTLSDDDVAQIRKILVKSIENINHVVQETKEQGVHCLVMDFFKL